MDPTVTHETTRWSRRAADLDAADPLAAVRDEFLLDAAPGIHSYLDGNSLGRPLKATVERTAAFVREQWGGRLIQGWTDGWMEWPELVGDQIGRAVLGAAPGPDRRRRLDHGAVLQARPRGRRRRPGRPRRDRLRHRQLPHRPLRPRGHRRRARPHPALDRDRPGRRASPLDQVAGRRGPAHRAGHVQPRGLPVRPPRRRAGHHRRGPRGRRPRAVGPEPLGRLGRAGARRVGRRPRRRMHLQVPLRRARRPGLRLPRPAPPRHAAPAGPGLDGPRAIRS